MHCIPTFLRGDVSLFFFLYLKHETEEKRLHRRTNVKCQLQDYMKKYYGSITETQSDTVSRQPVAGLYVPFILW